MYPVINLITAGLLLVPSAFAFGPSKTELELKAKVEAYEKKEAMTAEEKAAIIQRSQQLTELYQNYNALVWKVSRCAGTLGDSLENVPAVTKGRAAWSYKCAYKRSLELDALVDDLIKATPSQTVEFQKILFEAKYWSHVSNLVTNTSKDPKFTQIYPSWAHLPLTSKNIGTLQNSGRTDSDKLDLEQFRVEVAPTNSEDPCKDHHSDAYKDYRIVAMCEGGCYTPQMRVAYRSGELDYRSALRGKHPELMTLDSGSDTDSVTLRPVALHHFTVSPEPVVEEILTIRTGAGRELELTPLHPVMTANGRFARAGALKLGDLLVGADGRFDPVESITGKSQLEQVYNVQPNSSLAEENVVVAEGLLMGSVGLQNQDANDLNRILIRLNIPQGLLN